MREHDLWMVLGGSGELTVNGRSMEITGPQAFLLCPGDEVAGRHDPHRPLEVVALHFSPIRPERGVNWEERLRSVALEPVAFYRETAERVVTELVRGDELGGQVAAALALCVLGTLWRRAHALPSEEGDDRLEALVRLIEREPERTWTLDELAAGAAMGATRLNRRFNRLTGMAPMAWVIRCRVERAAILLRETELKLADVAEACGYRDEYFFSRQFRRLTGQAPGAWRRAQRRGSS